MYDAGLIIDLLNTCHAGRPGTIGRDGYPVVKPLNFAYHKQEDLAAYYQVASGYSTEEMILFI
jgi:nitroimidazol reductase NimA-like FMN-containing flavoprotein (pyridoxamine 5'-phosphate oxidase superfamily)